MKIKRPFTIGIGGSHSSIGKTTLAAALIRYLSSGHTSRLFGPKPRIGAIKYTKEAIYASLIDDAEILKKKGKDTARLGEAGAKQVLWIKSVAEDLGEVMPLALQRLTELDAVIIEGNSAIEFAKPDIVIFITGGPDADTKPSAERLKGLADIIITAGAEAGNHAGTCIIKELPEKVQDEELEVIIKVMEETAKKKEIISLLNQRAVDGKITCGAARKIAEELNVSYNEVGTAATDLKIKIRNCELGCF